MKKQNKTKITIKKDKAKKRQSQQTQNQQLARL